MIQFVVRRVPDEMSCLQFLSIPSRKHKRQLSDKQLYKIQAHLKKLDSDQFKHRDKRCHLGVRHINCNLLDFSDTYHNFSFKFIKPKAHHLKILEEFPIFFKPEATNTHYKKVQYLEFLS